MEEVLSWTLLLFHDNWRTSGSSRAAVEPAVDLVVILFHQQLFSRSRINFLLLTSALPFVTKATVSRINLGQLNILFSIILISECTRQQRQTRGISFAKLPISILSVLITKYNIRSLIRFLWIPHCCYVTELRDESERMHAVCKGTWRTYTLCVLLCLERESMRVTTTWIFVFVGLVFCVLL